VTLEGDYSSRVSNERWKRVPDTCPSIRKGTVAECRSTGLGAKKDVSSARSQD